MSQFKMRAVYCRGSRGSGSGEGCLHVRCVALADAKPSQMSVVPPAARLTSPAAYH
jgi:hypothetical protein